MPRLHRRPKVQFHQCHHQAHRPRRTPIGPRRRGHLNPSHYRAVDLDQPLIYPALALSLLQLFPGGVPQHPRFRRTQRPVFQKHLMRLHHRQQTRHQQRLHRQQTRHLRWRCLFQNPSCLQWIRRPSCRNQKIIPMLQGFLELTASRVFRRWLRLLSKPHLYWTKLSCLQNL